MEMCYDGALVMPSSYVCMTEEEMTYLEGGKVEATVSLSNTQCTQLYNQMDKYSNLKSFANAIMSFAIGAVISKLFAAAGIAVGLAYVFVGTFSSYKCMKTAVYNASSLVTGGNGLMIYAYTTGSFSWKYL